MSQLGAARPLARADLDVNEVPDGLVIYDGNTDRVHYLNQPASLIFCLCTGENDEPTIAEQVRKGFVLDRAPVSETANCLAELRGEGLVD